MIIMAFILDGNSGIGAHGWSDLGYMICLRNLFRLRAVTYINIFFQIICFPSNVRTVFGVTILYKYHASNDDDN